MDTDRSSRKAANSSAKNSREAEKPTEEAVAEDLKKTESLKRPAPKRPAKPKSLFNYDKGIPKEVKDVLEAMDENQDKLRNAIGAGIKISKFLQFEARCEELLGVEINPIMEYFSHNYATTKDKFLLTFDDFIDITQKWADSYLLQKDDDEEADVEYDHLEDEKLEMQARSKDNLVLKFDRHAEKIREIIFEKYAEKAPVHKSSKSVLLEKQDKHSVRNSKFSVVYIPTLFIWYLKIVERYLIGFQKR